MVVTQARILMLLECWLGAQSLLNNATTDNLAKNIATMAMRDAAYAALK